MNRKLYGCCPLCAQTNNQTVVLKEDSSKHALWQEPLPREMIWLQCGECFHVYVSGYFDDEALALLMKNSHAGQRVSIPPEALEVQRFIAGQIVDRILPYANSGSWLDIGFGNGVLLRVADEFGFAVMGTEARRENIAAMKELGIEARHYQQKMEERFRIISMMDVLEHMPFPKEFIQGLDKNLEPQGLLYISCPNLNSGIGLIAPYWYEIEHYHNFTRDRLYKLLEELGFEPLRYAVSQRYQCGMEVIARKR